MSARPWSGRTWIVWAWPLRPVPVVTCGLCGAIVLADGTTAHHRHHEDQTEQGRTD